MGSALQAYRSRYGLSDDDLAEWLRLNVADLPRLAGSPLPDRHADGFAREVRRLSASVSCDAVRLIVILTEPRQTRNLGSEQGVRADV